VEQFLEGFQAATVGYESNNWTHIGTVANISSNYDSTLDAAGKPDGACVQSWHVDLPTDGTETYARYDLGVGLDLDTIQTDWYVSFFFQGWTIPTNTEFYSIADWDNDTTPGATTLRLWRQGASDFQIYLAAQTASAKQPIVTGCWYTAKISFDTAAAAAGSSLTVWSNGWHCQPTHSSGGAAPTYAI